MSADARRAGASLRKKFARVFQVDIELVSTEELPDDEVRVWCPTKPHLPTWTTGPMP
jgi:hypothetical protein